MTSKPIQFTCSTAIILSGLVVASSVAAKWQPKPKAHVVAAKAKAHSVAKPKAAARAPLAGNVTVKPNTEVALSIGRGQLINLSQPISDIFTSNAATVDVHVRSAKQIYVFGKAHGNASVYATNPAGQIIYSANVQVDQNIDSIEQMLSAALPEAQITATRVKGGMIVLNGLVLNPEDAVQAGALVNSYVGNDPKAKAGKSDVIVLNRIKTATPQQVNLQVRIAEVSHNLAKDIGVKLNNKGSSTAGNTIFTGTTGGTTGTSLTLNAPNFLGGSLAATLDLAETNGDATTLAQPNLTALSGETASFLAGGEVPIPVSQSTSASNAITVEYKTYGVTLSFTPIVLADGRISMRVRPEVSTLDYTNAITLNGYSVPGFKTRRSETTVELGSGQSMVIGGLLQNNSDNSYTRTPGLGDVPVLGTMFRSNAYKRGETELMIVVTPYLVKPVNANQIVLPTDGYKAPTDAERVFLGKGRGGTIGGERPKPQMAPPATRVGPSVGALDPLPAPASPEPARPALIGDNQTEALPDLKTKKHSAKKTVSVDAAPGFGS